MGYDNSQHQSMQKAAFREFPVKTVGLLENQLARERLAKSNFNIGLNEVHQSESTKQAMEGQMQKHYESGKPVMDMSEVQGVYQRAKLDSVKFMQSPIVEY